MENVSNSENLSSIINECRDIAEKRIYDLLLSMGKIYNGAIIDDIEFVDTLKKININGFRCKLKRIEIKDYTDKYGWERKGIYFVFNGKSNTDDYVQTIKQLQVKPLCKIADKLMEYSKKVVC